MKNCLFKGLLCFFLMVSFYESYTQPFGTLLRQTPGIVSYSYRNSFPKDFGATLDTIKSMGISNIEFSNLFGKTAEEIKKLLDDRGMKCTSYGTNYNDLVNKTDEIAKVAQVLGAEFVRVAWIPHDKGAFNIEVMKKAIVDFNAAGKKLKEVYGLSFCYHNHGYEFQPYENGTYFDYFIANTDFRYVNVELDILWVFHPGADPATILEKYGKRIKLMHVKDLRKGVKGDFTGGTPVENDVAVGTGQIDIPAVLKSAKKSAIKYFYIEDESNSVNAQVPATLTYLKSL